ncbi:uncharacterized protein LOC109857155 [Pseudomyrmex gracilis]|uniref:uncharacterized protein LOC109857155 n=1 Tax=Pseudomyrmex gracilis TaxID=219809 RepID=UPI000995B8C0|nr:uncharacterized protein LOC109857155 [Pseudomyrmex gracilis]
MVTALDNWKRQLTGSGFNRAREITFDFRSETTRKINGAIRTGTSLTSVRSLSFQINRVVRLRARTRARVCVCVSRAPLFIRAPKMALKKKKAPKSETEQLYMLEILIDRLNVCPEKIVNDRECDLMIRASVIDLAPVDMTEESAKIKGGKSKNQVNRFPNENVNYEGKTCLFVRTPSNLIRSVKSTPLSVEVYRIPRGDNRNSHDDASRRILLCATTAFLPQCFCDQVAASKDKIDGLSKSYTTKEIYTLSDERGTACGSISMYLRLSCFGSSIINHMRLHAKSFVFRGFPFGSQFRCAKSSDENVNEKKTRIKQTDGRFSLLNQIFSPECASVCDRIDQNSRFALKRPCVSMNQPGFEKLTSAEKLNDREYRTLIYETYPDEPTCSCLPTDRSTHPMMCRSGCARSCCMALRNPDILKNTSDNVTSSVTNTYRVDNLHLKSGVEQDMNPRAPTQTEDVEDGEENSNSKVLRSEETNNKSRDRMKGGGDLAGASCDATTTVLFQRDRKNDSSACKSRPRFAAGIKAPSCICPRKDRSFWRTGTYKCTKKPCVGADCMIRAFKEAQEFVDSLGKITCMTDLGLMDPSDSPFFGRDVDRDYAVHEMPSVTKTEAFVPTTSALPIVQCPAPCNTQIGKPIGAVTPFVPSVSAAIPKRPGVVGEAIPTLPDVTTLMPVKSRKKEEKREEKPEKPKETDVTPDGAAVDEGGPCGEPKCKSRKRKPEIDRTIEKPQEIVEEPPKDVVLPPKLPKSKIIKRVDRGRRPKRRPGPNGDQDDHRFPIKISKRVMRYVYTIGDVYPGIVYGHKNCISPRMRVPSNMGWLWNTGASLGKLKPRIGWKPGAIGRYLNELLKEAKRGTSLMEDTRSRSVPSRTTQRRKVYKPISYTSREATKEGEEKTEFPPTLHIHRKDGTYYVTMYPIRQETSDEPQLEEPVKPLQFKIMRNKDDASTTSSSTASDMEIEFSPPAAVYRYRKKPDVIHVDTQVRQQEILDTFKMMDDVPERKKEKEREKEKKDRKPTKPTKPAKPAKPAKAAKKEIKKKK